MKSAASLARTLLLAAAVALAAPAAASAADDPLLTDQWALDSAAIGASAAWTQSNGAGVLVAVLDTGLQVNHPDLAANVWTNPGELAGNGRDDDNNGIVDDVHGANMFDMSNRIDDDNGHGTHVAGIVAARQGNGEGGSGIAPGAKVMSVKVLDANMSGNTDVLARGIRYAVDRGARILNVSINGDSATESLKAAVRYAGVRGAIIAASAGNAGRNIDLAPSYPAALPAANVLSVGATTSAGRLWSGSNIGLRNVELAAPGELIASTTRGSAYQMRTGTSAAAPFVAGSLALLSAARPDLPLSALRDALLATTRRTDIISSLIGGGQLDVGAAMQQVVGGQRWRTAAPADAVVPTLKLRAKDKVRAGARATLRWKAAGVTSVVRWRVSLNGQVVATLPATAGRIARRVGRTGRHTWRVVGLDANGARVVTARRAFRAVASR